MVREVRLGEESIDADVGWLLVGEGLACLRTVRDFLTQDGKGK
jgi:hypothetical protein